MDDEKLFGPVAYRYPFRRAIDEGWLKDYRIVVAAVTSKQVAELLAAEGDLAEGDVPVRMGAAQAALAMAAAEFGLRRCVAFLPRDRPGPPVRRAAARRRWPCCRSTAARPGRWRPGTCTAG